MSRREENEDGGFGQKIEVPRLMKAAEEQSGLTDWGAPDVADPLSRIAKGLLTESRLNARGRELALARLRMNLRNRLHVVEARKRHPEIARQKIVRPLVLLGLPRAGTTLTHHLLSQDPSARSPRIWEMLSPWPAGPADLDTDPRIPALQEQLARDGFLSKEVMRVHPFGANVPEEEGFLLESCFMSNHYNAFWRMPSYLRWFLFEAGPDAFYRYQFEFLQQCEWRSPGGRWVLKWPMHTFWVDALLRTYPDAVIVCNHRDPACVIPSVTKLQTTHQRRSSDHVDERAVAAVNFEMWAEGAKRLMRVREDPAVNARFFDIRFADLDRDPFGVIERLYKHFDLSMTETTRLRMADWLTANPRGKHGANKYSLAEFDLTETQIDAAFGAYMERFGVPQERS